MWSEEGGVQSPVIISINSENDLSVQFFFNGFGGLPSKSTVPDASVSISAIISFNWSLVSWSSRATKISLKLDVGIYPFPVPREINEHQVWRPGGHSPCLSYSLNASFSSFCRTSSSSFSRKLAATLQNDSKFK